MEDKILKVESIKLLWGLGYDVELEAVIVDPRHIGITISNITDIDVVGIKLTDDLRVQKILVDCKTLHNVSPINRVFWLKGIMEHTNSLTGYIILNKAAVNDHRILASRYNISLMEKSDVEILMSKLINPNINFTSNIFNYDFYSEFLGKANAIKEIKELKDYINRIYWNEDPAQQIRHILQYTKGISKNLSGKNKIISGYLLFALIKLYFALVIMVSKLFHIYLTKDSKKELDEHLKIYLYGGRENYEYFNKLYSGLVAVKKSVQKNLSLFEPIEVSQLSLPVWNDFLQLYKAMIENVAEIGQISRFYRHLLFDQILEVNTVDIADIIPSYTNKSGVLALQLFDYFRTACHLPSLISDPIEIAIKKYL